MKLLFLSLLFPIVSFGQISIDDNDLPSSEQHYYYSNISNPLSFDVSQTGPNFNWDVSMLTPASQDSLTTVSVGNTPLVYQLYFNNFLLYPDYLASYAQLAPDVSLMGSVDVTDRYDYYQITDSSFSIVGFGANINGLPASVRYNQIDQLFPLPLVYGLSDSSSADYLSSIPSLGTYGQWINRKIEVDGWGELVTPYSTYDVLRLKTTLYQKDTIFIDQLSFGSSFDRPVTTLYQWYANGEGVPVLEIEVQSGIINSMKYVDQLNVSVYKFPQNTLQLFPNPVNDYLNLNSNFNIHSIEIYNLQGVLINQMSYSEIINLSGLKSGIYILKLISSEAITLEKIVKR